MVALCWTTSAALAQRPNIVVILTDDQGYADISLNPLHPEEVSTPHMDALAAQSVVFSQAYTSGQVCSPTRAGLMLGRYQQRVGVYTAGDGGRGFDPDLPIFPGFLPADYRSTIIGKWHLGLDDDYQELKWHAMNRGFDECYKFMGRGGHSYFDLRSDSEGKFAHPLYRDKQRINDQGYLTHRLTQEAVAFIERNKARPFFLYLAYNAVHAPAEAPQPDIAEFQERYPGISEERAILMAMLRHLDDGVGEVVGKLKKEGLFENTLLFFLTDNGGSKAMSADNSPLRGFKGSFLEGGIRTPFFVSWPERFAGGRTVETPVISLDILPTALEALGVEGEPAFDGKSLLPLLTGASEKHHETLYWSAGGESGEWALRRGDWKLYGKKADLQLFQLAQDPSEEEDLSAAHPELVQELSADYEHWLASMAEPISGQARRWSPPGADGKADPAPEGKRDKQSMRDEKRAERVKQREQARAARQTPKNVLFIVCDDLNTHVTTSGYQPISTPAFDSLAAAGMTFGRAYCQYPVCGPSRASFLSGLYPQSTGVLDNSADIRDTRVGTLSMPECFQRSGYWTGAVGKVFHTAKIDPQEAAWDAVLRFENDELPMVTPVREAFEAEHGSIEEGAARRLWKERVTSIGTQTRGQAPPGYGPSGLRDEQHKDGKNARQVVAWLDEGAHGDQPFFMACGIQKPHVPFLAPSAYFELYPKEELAVIPARPDFWDQAPRMARSNRYQSFGFEFGVENDALRRDYMQAYHACISFIDAQIGLVLDALKRSGHWEDTIVILTSDHGYQLGEHFLWGKVTLFEDCARVPLLIRVPGRTEPGSRSAGLVELVDLFPTLTDLCGIAAPEDLQGSSLAPMLADASQAGKQVVLTVVSRRNELGRAIRTRRWRYAAWPTGEELYDLEGDPGENKNLVGHAGHTETLAEMQALLKRAEKRARSASR